MKDETIIIIGLVVICFGLICLVILAGENINRLKEDLQTTNATRNLQHQKWIECLNRSSQTGMELALCNSDYGMSQYRLNETRTTLKECNRTSISLDKSLQACEENLSATTATLRNIYGFKDYNPCETETRNLTCFNNTLLCVNKTGANYCTIISVPVNCVYKCDLPEKVVNHTNLNLINVTRPKLVDSGLTPWGRAYFENDTELRTL